MPRTDEAVEDEAALEDAEVLALAEAELALALDAVDVLEALAVLDAEDAFEELDAALPDDDPPHATSPIANVSAQHVMTIARTFFITPPFPKIA